MSDFPCLPATATALAALLAGASPAAGAQALSGAALYADVLRYESFGVHRYGSPGAERAFDWISTELARAGFAVVDQPFEMARQYQLRQARLRIGGTELPVLPHWWMPDGAERFSLSARIAPRGAAGTAAGASAEGACVRVSVPFDQGAYLNASHRQALEAAFARKPAAVLLTIDHPSGEIYTYNVSQTEPPWPVPVILVAGRHGALLDAAESAGTSVDIDIDGSLQRNVRGRNVIGRLDRGKGRAIVVSTPVTSWDVSTCERGPGIAGFLAMARIAGERLRDVDLVFVATAGHEIGHGGMEHFIRSAAPRPETVAAWAHFGASLACYGWRREGDRWVSDGQVDSRLRFVNASESLAPVVEQHFGAIKARRLTGAQAAIGELREVRAAGYGHFMGMAGGHTFFHTPADTAAATGPEILEPVIRAFADALGAVAAGGAR
ncbi:MAG: hypothetical protein ACKVQR_15170 [Aquabacterium sp.]